MATKKEIIEKYGRRNYTKILKKLDGVEVHVYEDGLWIPDEEVNKAIMEINNEVKTGGKQK